MVNGFPTVSYETVHYAKQFYKRPWE